MKTSISETIKRIQEAKAVAIICHENPDGDTLGAAKALQLALGEKARIYCAQPTPDRYTFLEIGDMKSPIEVCDLVVYVDCSDRERTGDLMDKIPTDVTTINIDHHGTNTKYADINVVDGKISSTCEIIYPIIQSLSEITPAIATCLYTGMVTDTGMFSFGYTTSSAYRIAAELIDGGADFESICQRLFRTRTVASTMLTKVMLDRLSLSTNNRVAFSYLMIEDFEKHNAKVEEAERLVNMMIQMDSVEIAIFAKELEQGGFKLSLRSKGGVDVSKLAMAYGGGGHAQASGCRVEGNANQLEDKLLSTIAELQILS